MTKIVSSPVVVALDYSDEKALLGLVDQLDPSLCRLKVGKEVFTRFGPQLVTQLINRNFDVFLDLKFHDIPNTVAKAVSAAADLGVWMVNVHALGGKPMLAAAVNALSAYQTKPLLIAVTVLTSTSDEDLAELGLPPAESLVNSLAQLSLAAKLDGVVCSAQEANQIKSLCGKNFLTVTPGIRPIDASLDDQHRVMTPAKAIANGADYLVIGRPITQHANPYESLLSIVSDLDNA